MLLLTVALAVEPVTVVAIRRVMEAARGVVTVTARGPVVVVAPGLVTVAVLGPVIEAVLGPVIEAVLGPVIEAALGPVIEAALGPVTVTLLGEGTVTDFTMAGVFLVQVSDSLATITLGTIRAIPITLIPRRTMTIPTLTAGTTAIRITVISTTKTLILARPLQSRSKPLSQDVVTTADRLTVCLGRRLAMQFDHFRRIKVCRLPAR
jgi:hypothetical protein